VNSVAILGLGLMGGSLGLALKRAQPGLVVHGHTRSVERGRCAVERGAVDHFHTDASSAVAGADLVVLCAPILAIPAQLAAVRDALKRGAVVTDVGSTKAEIQKQCHDLLAGRDALFVGSHPIAGSEQQGMESAKVDLYEKAMVVITPDSTTPRHAVIAIASLWKLAGAVVSEMSPEAHDRILALTSHVPHVMASLLAATVGRPGLSPDLPAYCGSGYRDTTRIAEGGVDIWLDILRTNRGPIATELKVLRLKLDALIEQLEQNDISAIERALSDGKNARKAFTAYGHQHNSEE
jgi:prephenate dehydrogenase